MQEVICGNMIPIRDQWGMLARLDSFFAEEANYAGVAGGLRLGDDVKLNRIFQEKHDVNDRRIISPLGFLRIDTEHMPQSVESWLHVIVIDCPVNYPHSLSLSGEPVEIEHLTEESHTTNSGHSNFSGFAGTKAILTWPNSD